MPVRIKVCGITTFEDARTAASLGFDAVGFIFHRKSPRFVSPECAAAIIRRLPPFISRVGVFVDEPIQTVIDTAAATGIDTIQLHGNEGPDYCDRMPLPVVKAFPVGPSTDLGFLAHYRVAGFLLDTWAPGTSGGTGRTFDWSIARSACLKSDRIILAGGLNPGNVAEALETVHPYGLDLNSGVEIKPGVKNPRKMRDAVRAIRLLERHGL